MPFLRLTLNPAAAAQAADPELARELAFGLRDLTANVLGKKAHLVSLLVEAPPTLSWSIGDAQPGHAIHLEVTITQGKNTAADKERFIDAAVALLKSVFSTLHEATYIVITEAPASDWGYDGRTQEARRAPAPA